MRSQLKEFYNICSGMDVFIIGGGPSVNLINKDLLKGKVVVCINNAYQLFPDASALYWCDDAWAGNHLDDLLAHPTKLRFSARHSADFYIQGDILGSGNACIVKRTGDFGIDTNPDHVRGNNGGTQCLNLVFNMKAHRIILIGFDGQLVNGKSHWHKGHGLPMSNSIYTDLFIPSFESMAPFIKQSGIEVINASPCSKLKCFNKQSLENIL